MLGNVLALPALLVVAVACTASPASELSRLVEVAPPLDGYQVNVAIADPSTIFACFPVGGTLTIAVMEDTISVFDDPNDDPVLIVDGGGLALRPDAFSSGPDEWWAIEASTNVDSVRRVIGPVIAELALGDEVDRPHRQLVALVAAADSVERLGGNRFRIVDRTAEPTVLDVTLDGHGHLVQLVVAAEDPQRPGRADNTQVSYTARYRHGTGVGRFQVRPDRHVNADELDTLDDRPGACGPVVAP
jgi:hypothetical protein